MRAWRPLLAGLVALALLAGAPGRAQETEPAPPVEPTVEPTGQPTGAIALEDAGGGQDAAVARRIAGILAALEGYEDIRVAVSAGIVTLEGEAVDGAAVARLDAIVSRLEGVVALDNEVRVSTDVARRLDPVMRRFADRGGQFLAFLPLLAVAGAALAMIAGLGYALAAWRRPWERLAPNQFVGDIYRQILRLAFVVLGVVVALDILGATALLGTILGAAGILGLAVGFAVRDTIENFIASVMLSFRQPFRPNDLVEIEGDTGKVIRLTSRATILLDLDGNQIRIPNATVFKARIVNFTRNRERRFQFEMTVDPGADLVAVREAAARTVAGLPFTLPDPPPLAWVDRIADGKVIFIVTGWIDQREVDFARARGEAIRLVRAVIEDAGAVLADPTLDVRLTQGARAREASGAAPEPAPCAAPEPAPPATERALDRMIALERGDAGRPDLLDVHAPEE